MTPGEHMIYIDVASQNVTVCVDELENVLTKYSTLKVHFLTCYINLLNAKHIFHADWLVVNIK